MINLGIDPATSGPEEWKEAAAWLQMLVATPTFRAAYTRATSTTSRRGTSRRTMGWSGDVLYYTIWEDYPFEFVVPEGGARAVDRQHADPGELGEPAGRVQDDGLRTTSPRSRRWSRSGSLYMSPVPEVQELIADARRGDGATDGPDRTRPRTRCCGPTTPLLANDRRSATASRPTRRRAEWDAIFIPISGGVGGARSGDDRAARREAAERVPAARAPSERTGSLAQARGGRVRDAGAGRAST